ncbi:hypothetical protein FN846DRAFT_907251, partial [Sphaerosporella brunnea]
MPSILVILPAELLVEIGLNLTSPDIYHLMQTCRSMHNMFDSLLYTTAVCDRHRLQLVLTRNHCAVRRLLATGALDVDFPFRRECDHGLAEYTRMVYVAMELMDE